MKQKSLYLAVTAIIFLLSSYSLHAQSVASDLEKQSNWQSCDVCAGAGGNGPGADYGMDTQQDSPSLDGASTRFWIGGDTPYADVLWWKNIVGWGDSTNQQTRHFVYDLSFYMDNPNASQGIEWDVDQFVDGRSLIFGSQCSYRSEGTWDIWDNVNSQWVSTGVACPTPEANAWNHVVLEFERTDDNQLHYIAMTMNDQRNQIDAYYDSTATDWDGISVNFQLDGNYRQEHYSTWVNQASLTYW